MQRQSDHDDDVRVLYGVPVVDSFECNGRRIYTLCDGDLNERLQRMGLLVRVQVNSIAESNELVQGGSITFCSGGGSK